MKLVFASNNMHKLKEIRDLMPFIQILSLKDIGCNEEIEETKKSYTDYIQDLEKRITE